MRQPAQTRILYWLGKFSKELEFEWDVPRDISLPGISEALGVVRSALHKPINSLEDDGMVKSRIAHVMGGGSRKRKVYHLTEKGHDEFTKIQSNEIKPRKKKKYSLIGEFPPLVDIIGRDEIKEEIVEQLVSEKKLLMVGMAGIGKSALSRTLAEDLIEKHTVRWGTVTKFTDVEAIIKTWSGEDIVPSDSTSAADWICENLTEDLLILDEIQNIHRRHRDSITNLLKNLFENPKSPMILLVSRAPAPIQGWKEIRIDGLDYSDAAELLDQDISLIDRLNISKILGGHPLALQIAGASDEIPEKSKDVQQFISDNILSQLDEEIIHALDELAALSVPIETHILGMEEEVGELDERALVRWMMKEDEESPSKIELQHLIRNVRRAQWSADKRKSIHLKIAENLSRFKDEWARSLELYHRINADYDDLENWINLNMNIVENADSATLSVVLNEALNARPEIEKLWIIATKIAINRGEKGVAEELMENAKIIEKENSQWLEIKSRLCRLNGDEEKATQLIQDAMSIADPVTCSKIKVAEISRKIVDRLPHEKITDIEKIKQMIAEIDTSSIFGESKKTLIVTIAILQHTIAVVESDWKNAEAIRKDLMTLTQKNDPLIWEMECREMLYSQNNQTPSVIEKMLGELGKIRISIRRCGMLLVMIERGPNENRKTILDNLTKEIKSWGNTNNNQNGRRIRALRWYWKGELFPNEKLIAWRECAKSLQSAECSNATRNIVKKLHNLLN